MGEARSVRPAQPAATQRDAVWGSDRSRGQMHVALGWAGMGRRHAPSNAATRAPAAAALSANQPTLEPAAPGSGRGRQLGTDPGSEHGILCTASCQGRFPADAQAAGMQPLPFHDSSGLAAHSGCLPARPPLHTPPHPAAAWRRTNVHHQRQNTAPSPPPPPSSSLAAHQRPPSAAACRTASGPGHTAAP